MGGPSSGRWGNYRRRIQVEECLPLDTSDLGQLGILASPSVVAGRLGWQTSPGGDLLGSATYRLGPPGADETRELRLRLSAELDPTCQVQLFKLERVAIGCAPRWLLLCPECGERRARRLFLPPKSKRFACKRCHALHYRSVQQHDVRLDRLIKAIRCGDETVVEKYRVVGRRGGYRGFSADRLFLTALAKAFPSPSARRANPGPNTSPRPQHLTA